MTLLCVLSALGCSPKSEILQKIKSTTYIGELSIAEFLLPFTSESQSAVWKFDNSYHPENTNWVKVTGSVPIEIGRRNIAVSLTIIWDKETESIVSAVQNFGRLTDYGENLMSIYSLDIDKQEIAKSCFYWFATYKMLKVFNALTEIEIQNLARESGMLLPW